ncbi:interleukin-1 receptor-like 2 isoform X2 [Anguilla rostrata]|uniref:interleukin-1 receptor-like 2 isoform X2 n=1 Tax=Anguilla rostrata TaxID=7938 RepID=UPI0030CDA1ED
MDRTCIHIKGEFLCTFLVGIVLASSSKSNGQQGAVDRYYAASGQFFQLKHGVAPGKLGGNVTFTWGRGAHGNLDRTSSRVRIINGSLFFLPVHLSDEGYYTWKTSDVTGAWTVEKTVFLSVVGGACPEHSDIIPVQKGTTDSLHCGLQEIFTLDKSTEISWLKDCNPMNFHEKNIRITHVSDKDEGNYTCLINFTFEGKKFSTSWTIQLRLKDDPPLLEPKVIRPQNETIRVKPGVKAELDCKVFVGMNKEIFDETNVYWLVNHTLIEIYSHPMKKVDEDSEGIYKLSRLVIEEVRPELFHVPFQCIVCNSLGQDMGVAHLAPVDDRNLHIFVCAAVPVIVIMVIIYHHFKVDITLTYWRLRPFKTIEDGKLYDAYVSCVHNEALCSFQLENFCLQVLPEVLEHCHGYNLFIRGRDDLPGEAAPDVISEAIGMSRRLIIVVSAHSHGDLDVEGSVLLGLKLGPGRDRHGDQPDLEQQIGLYDALVEDRLRVILVEIGKCVDYSHYPESIRYLKQKQGALRYIPGNGDPTAPPNCRFWKYFRYHMPHRPEGSTSTKSLPRPNRQFCL